MKLPGEWYSVETWDHDASGWESREICNRARLGHLLRELRSEGWDRPSVYVRRLERRPVVPIFSAGDGASLRRH
jgi:hypothetical protein